MHSLTASACLFLPHNSFADLNSLHFPSLFFVVDSRGRRRALQQFAALNLVKENGSLLGCLDSFKKGNCYKGLYWGYSGFLRRCKDWDCEGDFSLEAEILEFMKNSKNPQAFPTKKELIDSGRMDLVDAIIKKGGWLAFGWNLDEEAEEVHVKGGDFLPKNDCHVKHEISTIDNEDIWGSGRVFPSATFSQPTVSPGRSVEIAEQSGIEGILNRLEIERNSALGLGFRHKEDNVSPGDSEDKDERHHGSTINSGQESSSDDLQKLSDAWEFQENEILKAKDRLRSIRAKLAVLDGKMTLAIMDAGKIIEEKQNRIDNASRALRFLKTTCVVWANAASEVLLAGSFDGWSSKRKMEKSDTGVFSVYLHLYPGKYEIKFIVDGEWKTDPLRPVVHNNGHENNLLIIQE